MNRDDARLKTKYSNKSSSKKKMQCPSCQPATVHTVIIQLNLQRIAVLNLQRIQLLQVNGKKLKISITKVFLMWE